MTTPASRLLIRPGASPRPGRDPAEVAAPGVVLSFDVEEHDRIEAAAGLRLDDDLRALCRARLEPPTRWLLDLLERHGLRATFFVVGQVARREPALVRAIHRGGHELASHGWDHRRLHHLTPEEFRDDLRQGRDALEQVTGEPVVGYRAPTFSVVHRTSWALDVLAEEGLLYDASIYPVRHDRYGVPDAPRGPFLACGPRGAILELPPATLRLPGLTLPAGGGGYFRLLPLWITRWAIRQARRGADPAAAMLYFHPWEFDPDQRQLPLPPLSRFRTYVGTGRSRGRLEALLARAPGPFERAVDVARRLEARRDELPRCGIGRAAP